MPYCPPHERSNACVDYILDQNAFDICTAQAGGHELLMQEVVQQIRKRIGILGLCRHEWSMAVLQGLLACAHQKLSG